MLNELGVTAADIQNTYLQAPSSEKHYIVCAAEESQYWEYVLLYADDCLVISDNGEKILREEIGKYFKLNFSYQASSREEEYQ